MNVRRFVLSYYEDATEDFYITRVHFPKEALELHSHNYFQIYYVLGGKVYHHLEENTATLSAGDVFILPPNQPHYIDTQGEKVDFYSLSFTADYFQSLRDANKLILDYLLYLQTEQKEMIQPKLLLSSEDAAFAKVLLQRIHGEFSGERAGKSEIIRESLSVLLSLFARVHFESCAKALVATENRQLVLHSIEYIKNHFDEELTLSELVRRAAMSKTCFCTLFHDLAGMSFKEFLNRCRVEKARELMETGAPISVAAGSCGYSDFSTFYRNFKKYAGLSPTAYLQNCKESSRSEKEK